jgi:hypothetical protein
LISLKAFSYSSRKGTIGLPFFPLCGFIEGFGQEGVVRDPDSAETSHSPKLSELPASLKGWDETGSLFPVMGKPVLPLGQVKAEVFDGLLANLGLFPRDFVS